VWTDGPTDGQGDCNIAPTLWVGVLLRPYKLYGQLTQELGWCFKDWDTVWDNVMSSCKNISDELCEIPQPPTKWYNLVRWSRLCWKKKRKEIYHKSFSCIFTACMIIKYHFCFEKRQIKSVMRYDLLSTFIGCQVWIWEITM
jgi:hypothetical protein